jgi:hypothetical protein
MAYKRTRSRDPIEKYFSPPVLIASNKGIKEDVGDEWAYKDT